MDDRKKKIDDDEYDAYDIQELIEEGKQKRLLICIGFISIMFVTMCVLSLSVEYKCVIDSNYYDVNKTPFSSIDEVKACYFKLK